MDGNAIIAAINSATSTINASRIDPSLLLHIGHHNLSVTDHNDFFDVISGFGVSEVIVDGDSFSGSITLEEDSTNQGIIISGDTSTDIITIGIDHGYLSTRYVDLYSNQTAAGEKVWSNNAYFNSDVMILGNLTVQGTTTSVNSTNLEVEDNIILINKGETGGGVSAGTAGLEIDRGTSQHAFILYDETDDKWKVDAGTGTTYQIWHEGNQGHLSGLDADTLDGHHASDFGLAGDYYTKTESDDRFVNITGDTMTGDLIIREQSSHAALELDNGDGATYFNSILRFKYNTANRFAIYTVSNSTSDLKISRYDDSGNFVNDAITINRNTDSVVLSSSSLRINGDYKAAGYFYTGTVDPTNTDRLNYDGYFYATRVYNAVYNDYADFIDAPCSGTGYGLAYTIKDGCTEIAQKGDYVVGIATDTYAFAAGARSDGMPIAVAGFVLAFVDKVYKPGTPLKVKKDGILTKASLFDKIFNMSSIVAFFYKSESRSKIKKDGIEINVYGRHWVKIK